MEGPSDAAVPMPVWFLSHGPGPAWLLPPALVNKMIPGDKIQSSGEALKSLVQNNPLPRAPRALLVVSAHWEEEIHTISTNPKPNLYYDYYNFPEEAYKVTWGAPGGTADVINRTKEVLKDAGIPCAEDGRRGLDHGVFVPLKLVFPKADIPVFQVSMKNNMKLADHLKLGEALSCLRQEGILIIGSGHTTHNSDRSSGLSSPSSWATEFQDWIHDVLTNPAYSSQERRAKLMASEMQQTFRKAHPRNDHYLPILVIAAAAGYKPGTIMFSDFIFGSLLCSHLKYP